MSNYNWERGTIKIPTKAWKGLRDSLVDKANERRASLLSTALRLHKALSDRTLINKAREHVKAHNKTLPAKNRIKLVEVTPFQVFMAVNGDWNGNYTIRQALDGKSGFSMVKVDQDDEDSSWALKAMLFPYDRETQKRKRLAKPKKSDEHVKPLVRTKVDRIEGPDCSVHFDHKSKSITWDVDENNRAVERANESWLGRLLFRLLDRIEWTRGSGGKIVGNDEYNRDSDYEGGGGNYVTHEYGPKVKPKRSRVPLGQMSSWGYGYRSRW